jgi:nucleoside-diphosphate-sugar epimerase
MKIILTGSNGFLGKSIFSVLNHLEIIDLARTNASISCDLSTQIPNFPAVNIVIHCAGKAHSVPKTPQQKQEFFDVNVTGTQNLLKGLEQAPSLPKSFVFISTVAVYGLDKGNNILESQSLNARDPYGLSKKQAEEVVQEWCAKNNVVCTILRLPLLVGQNPPGNLGAMIKAIQKGYYMNIAGGLARKSMVMAEDVAKIILVASEIGGIYNLTDGYHPNFNELSLHIAQQLNKRKPLNIPKWMASLMAKVGDLMGEKSPFNSYKLLKITADLTFDDSKAREILGWNPQPVLQSFKIK